MTSAASVDIVPDMPGLVPLEELPEEDLPVAEVTEQRFEPIVVETADADAEALGDQPAETQRPGKNQNSGVEWIGLRPPDDQQGQDERNQKWCEPELLALSDQKGCGRII